MMFKARHDELLEHVFFSGPTEPRSDDGLQVVEMWKYEGIEDSKDKHNFRHRSLQEQELGSWLAADGAWRPPKPQDHRAVLEGGIRLLFCERVSFRPPGFGMSREAYLTVEREFNLPQNTLDAAFSYEGVFSKQFRYEPNGTLKIINFVLKAPQKMPIANYLLALSHNVSTGMTTAFIHGAFLHVVLPTIRTSLLEAPIDYTSERRHHDYHQFHINTHDERVIQSAQIVSHLRYSANEWSNPILLPITLLENYIMRSKLFAQDLGDQIVALERQTGVVFAGRNVQTQELTIQPEQIPKVSIRKLTQDMHTLLTEIIFFERVVEWSSDCASFLEKCTMEINGAQLPEHRTDLVVSNRDALENIEYLAATCKSIAGIQRASKERVQSQIGVLYSFIAQIDNSINAKIAVSSARDSSAMKTLALITTIFLPGTYVATLFSMSMFDWASESSNPADNGDTVSKKFWIYWVVTVPLTLLVIVLWRIWWLWQEKSYQREVNDAVGQVEDDDSTLLPHRKPRQHGKKQGKPGWYNWRKAKQQKSTDVEEDMAGPNLDGFSGRTAFRLEVLNQAASDPLT